MIYLIYYYYFLWIGLFQLQTKTPPICEFLINKFTFKIKLTRFNNDSYYLFRLFLLFELTGGEGDEEEEDNKPKSAIIIPQKVMKSPLDVVNTYPSKF